MKPSDPVRPGRHSTPGQPFVDESGLNITRPSDIQWIVELERHGKISSDLSFFRAGAAKLGLELPEVVLAIFYFPWAAGRTTADGSRGQHDILSAILRATLAKQAVQALEPFIESHARLRVYENVKAHMEIGNTEGVIDLAKLAEDVAFHTVSKLIGMPRSPEDAQFMLRHLREISNRQNFLDVFRPEEQEVREYIDSVVAQHPPNSSDLLGRAIAAHQKEIIDDNQLRGLVLGTQAAGRETSAILTSLVFGLVDEAGLQADMVANCGPNGASWYDSVVHEAARFTPFAASPRVSVARIDLDGFVIEPLTLLQLRWDAANRDPETFGPDADKFRPDRPRQKHMAFGHGMHYCLGEFLGKTEAAIVARVVYGTLGAFKLVEWCRQIGFADTVATAMAVYDLREAARNLA